jgi:hypothetical protein
VTTGSTVAVVGVPAGGPELDVQLRFGENIGVDGVSRSSATTSPICCPTCWTAPSSLARCLDPLIYWCG